MSQAPAMPVFCDALIGDTTTLSAAEFGAYCLLLFVTWRNNGEPLPDDDKRLARVCRMSPAQWAKVRPVLEGFFDLSGGTWRQKRLEKEWEYVASKIAKNQENGRRGGRPKSLELNEQGKANGSANNNPDETQQESTQPHTQYSVSIETEANPPPKAIDPAKLVFDSGVALLTRYGMAQSAARKLIGGWRKKATDAQLLEIIARTGSAERSDVVEFVEGCLRLKALPAAGTTYSDPWERRVADFAKDGSWFPHWGDSPAKPGCPATNSVLVKYGFRKARVA